MKNTITLSKEALKAIAKNEYYDKDNFIKDCLQWAKAIKEGRIICSVVSVSKSGMSRKLKFLSYEPSNTGERGYYRQYNTMLETLGFKYSRENYSITVNGCGMDMIFHTNYTIIHNIYNMGMITKKECDNLSQQTPTNI